MPREYLTYKRGEIWWIDLNPAIGSETKKQRPCVILQNDIGNVNSATTIVAPLLKGNKSYSYSLFPFSRKLFVRFLLFNPSLDSGFELVSLLSLHLYYFLSQGFILSF